MSEGSCAHVHVSYRTREDTPGHVVEAWWECDSGCGAKFAPEPSKLVPRPGFLDDGRALFAVALSNNGIAAVMGPDLVVSGFGDKDDAFGWLRQFLDDVARRNLTLAQEREVDERRLAIEREEMLARLLEPKTKQ